MKQWLYNLNRKMQHFMIGRYGMDEMSKGLVGLGVVLIFLSFIPQLNLLSIPAWALIFYTYYRCFSRNIIKRTKERGNYLKFTYKLRTRTNIYKKIWNEKNTYKYFKCSKCHTFVRVPRGKGKIAVRCIKCNNEMIKKS